MAYPRCVNLMTIIEYQRLTAVYGYVKKMSCNAWNFTINARKVKFDFFGRCRML